MYFSKKNMDLHFKIGACPPPPLRALNILNLKEGRGVGGGGGGQGRGGGGGEGYFRVHSKSEKYEHEYNTSMVKE